MPLFTDQFNRRDPRSTTPPISGAFNFAACRAHELACALVADVPLEKLAEICAALSGRYIELFPGLGLDWQSPWNYDAPPLADRLDFGVSLSVVYGAYALWKLTDFRDMLDPLGSPFGGAALLETDIPPERVYEVAVTLLAAMRGCLLAQQFQLAEERAKSASKRNSENILRRHERTTHRHRAEAVGLAAAAYRSGNHDRSSVADIVMDQVFKGLIEQDGKVLDMKTYEKKTILGWLKQAGWVSTKAGWPNCPKTTEGRLRA
jgi:hypothetical protein